MKSLCIISLKVFETLRWFSNVRRICLRAAHAWSAATRQRTMTMPQTQQWFFFPAMAVQRPVIANSFPQLVTRVHCSPPDSEMYTKLKVRRRAALFGCWNRDTVGLTNALQFHHFRLETLPISSWDSDRKLVLCFGRVAEY